MLYELQIEQSLFCKDQILTCNDTYTDNETAVFRVLDVLFNYEVAKSKYEADASVVLPNNKDVYFSSLGFNAKNEYWYLLGNIGGSAKWLWNESYLKLRLNQQ